MATSEQVRAAAASYVADFRREFGGECWDADDASDREHASAYLSEVDDAGLDLSVEGELDRWYAAVGSEALLQDAAHRDHARREAEKAAGIGVCRFAVQLADAAGIARCTSDTFAGDQRYLVTVPVAELRVDPNPLRYEVSVDRKVVLATDDLNAALDAAEAHGGRPRAEFFAWPTTRAWIGTDRKLVAILDLQGPPGD